MQLASLSEFTGWQHPVDFSPDGTALAVGNDDGLVRIWNVERHLQFDITTILSDEDLTTAAENIPEPVPPSADVRHFFQLDPYYEQWINVGGLPVIASAKVNPYALKEAAWLILKMIGHRPDVLRTMVLNKARFSVIPYTEVITEIPEYRSDPFPHFLIFHIRGAGGSEEATVSAGEESILDYPGETETFNRGSSILIHEFGHAIHLLRFNTLDPTFEERLRMTYEAAMKKGLWQGTYASRDKREYWAEGTMAWFYPNGSAGSFARLGNTRRALKEYDPELATLLAEVWGDREWRYTPVATRTHLPHLQGFNPQDAPDFEWWPELTTLDQQLRDPNSDGDGAWIDLEPYSPDQLSQLTKPLGDTSMVIFVNFTQADVFYFHQKDEAWYKILRNSVRYEQSKVNQIWLIKDSNERNIAAFQAVEKTGRVVIGTPPSPVVSADVNNDGAINVLDLVFVAINFGKTDQNSADVNGDGIVNIVDLVKVAGEIGAGTAAPSAHPQILEILTEKDVRQWLTQAQQANLADAASQRGILMLEQLLAALIPKETSLLSNYPNPFNPETWIPYQLAQNAEVTLTIYAADGKVVRTLALGQQPAGIYRNKNRAVYWDGRNAVGEPVASGVYFYTLEASEFTATRKMLIRK